MSIDPKSINFREFRTNLSTYLREAHEGAEIIVTSRGKEIARVIPPVAAAQQRARLAGMFRGRLQMSPDFDETPAELIEVMEGDLD